MRQGDPAGGGSLTLGECFLEGEFILWEGNGPQRTER